MAYAVIRNYKGASQLIDELQQRSDEVEQLIRGIPGLVHYVLVRSDDGGFSVSVYENREGAEESVRQARDYVQKNLSDVAVAPEVLQITHEPIDIAAGAILAGAGRMGGHHDIIHIPQRVVRRQIRKTQI